VLLAADILCICGFFVSVTDFFPVIYSWALVHQSSMFRVVDVLLVIQLPSMNGFLLSVMNFFSCVSWSTPCSSFKVLRLSRYERRDRKSAISLQRGQFDPKFQVESVAPTDHFCTAIVRPMNALQLCR